MFVREIIEKHGFSPFIPESVTPALDLEIKNSPSENGYAYLIPGTRKNEGVMLNAYAGVANLRSSDVEKPNIRLSFLSSTEGTMALIDQLRRIKDMGLKVSSEFSGPQNLVIEVMDQLQNGKVTLGGGIIEQEVSRTGNRVTISVNFKGSGVFGHYTTELPVAA